MNQLNDKPSLEVQVALLIDHSIHQSESINKLNETVEELRLLQREQNSNVSKSIDRQNNHDKWHGPNDSNIEDRLHLIEVEREEEKKNKIYQDGVLEGRTEIKIELSDKDKMKFGRYIAVIGIGCTVLGFLINNISPIIHFFK